MMIDDDLGMSAADFPDMPGAANAPRSGPSSRAVGSFQDPKCFLFTTHFTAYEEPLTIHGAAYSRPHVLSSCKSLKVMIVRPHIVATARSLAY